MICMSGKAAAKDAVQDWPQAEQTIRKEVSPK